MEKSMRNLSSCHVLTRPAYQAPSANMLSYLNQLDPARRSASRRHTLTSHREKGTLCSWPRLKNVFTRHRSIVSAMSVQAHPLMFSWTNSSKTMFMVPLCRYSPDLAKTRCYGGGCSRTEQRASLGKRPWQLRLSTDSASTITQRSGRHMSSESAMHLSGVINSDLDCYLSVSC